jgi:hypothetical protein
VRGVGEEEESEKGDTVDRRMIREKTKDRK